MEASPKPRTSVARRPRVSAERWRRPLLESRLLEATGTLQREGEVLHLIVARLTDHSRLLGELLVPSRDFH